MRLLAFLDRFALPRFKAVPDVPEEFSRSPVAGALCMLAVAQWSRSYEEHIILAGAAFDACCNGFANVEVPEFARQELLNTIKEAAKRGKQK